MEQHHEFEDMAHVPLIESKDEAAGTFHKSQQGSRSGRIKQEMERPLIDFIGVHCNNILY